MKIMGIGHVAVPVERMTLDAVAGRCVPRRDLCVKQIS
jgi:hypothetical protein